MVENLQALQKYLVKFGFEPKLADLYVALQTYGTQTISELARNAGVERIHIYRLLDAMKKSGLFEFEVRYKRTVLRAAPFGNLKLLLSEREHELEALQQEHADLSLAFRSNMKSVTTRVQFFEGIDSLKRMLWSETKGKSENLAILYENLHSATDRAFFERWIARCNERGVRSRGIIGDHFIKTQQAWYQEQHSERMRHWQTRHIPENVLAITHSTVTYDDKVLHYSWRDKRVFGIEIQNADIARMQRQLFEVLWTQAVPVDDVTGVRLP